MTKYIKKITAIGLVVASIVAMTPRPAFAAALTGLSDNMSSQKIGTASNHTIAFVTPSGVGAGETITVTFPSGFTIGSVDNTDIDVTGSTAGELTLGATASAGTWGAAFSSQTLTITSGTGTIAPGETVTIEIGTHATAGATGDQQITNHASASTYSITIAGTFGDTGSILIPILNDDQVNITAEVGQTLTFSISDTTIGFGTLTSGNARYASGDALGTTTTAAPAHNLIVGTNASSGYNVTYEGATLTSGSDTITAATISGDANGTPGTEQFAISYDTDGDATIASGYEQASDNYNFVVSTATTFASETSASANETIGAYYIANIATLTEAGSYSTTLTYTATANY